MSTVPLFQRSPRTFPAFPSAEVEIQAPPPVPTRPTSSLVAVLLPLGFTALGLGLSAAFLATYTSGLMLSVPLMLGSGLVGVITYASERKKYRGAVAKRQQDYYAYLQECRRELEQLAEEQRRAAFTLFPDPQVCLDVARRQNAETMRRLWERSSGLERPRDPDFLHLRLGLGSLPATFKVKPPSARPQVGESDDLHDEGMRLAQEFASIENLPVILPLAQVGAAGLAGPAPVLRDLTRALLLHLAALHAPHEVKLVALLPGNDLAEWDWIRWLPHVWDDERKRRFIAATPEDARQLLAALSPQIQRRALGRAAAQDEKALFPQTYLFLFADPTLYSAGSDTSVVGPLMHLLLTQGAAIGAYALFLHDRVDALPSACGAVVDLFAGRLRLVGPPTQEIPFRPDAVGVAEADAFARALAPIRMKALAAQADLPSSVTLLELLKARSPQDVPVAALWGQRDSHQSLEAPVGIESGGGSVLINFQDAARGGDGSHAMIGGTTGTGKTRFLQTLITLLAVHHHPHDLSFILIDYKGGDLLQGLEDLPHVVGTLANLEKQDTQAVLIERLFVCLEAELRRRRNLLGGDGINKYQSEFLQGKRSEPMPHLFVVIDEFAEMIRNSPDKASMTKRLLSIGATGRSLGVHLILATQDPSGVVNDELRNNINIRLCLRMGSREASMAILRLPDAYENITGAQVGRAYLQVGNNDRFVPFQVAWGGEKYIPGQTHGSAALAEVTLSGERRPLRRFVSLAPGDQTHLTALAAHIIQTAKDLGLARLPSPLSMPLRETIYLDELRRNRPGWNGHGWDTPAVWMAPIIGQMDDPANQTQDPLCLPLGREGHFALYGEPGSGKTTFVQTLVTSLALDHSPEDVQVYIVDISGRQHVSLRAFPHVGDVFLADDVERMRRFFRFLQRELQERKGRFTSGAGNLETHRKLTGDPLPAIVVILEDYAAFNKLCMDRNLDLDDALAALMRDGGSYGLHFVLTLTAPSELKSRLANMVSLAATFHLATPDYGMVVGPTGGMQPPAIPGRGLFKAATPLEFQTALPVTGQSDVERTAALKRLMEAMDGCWNGRRPRPFPSMPSVLGLSALALPLDRWADSPPAGYVAHFALPYDEPDVPFGVSLGDGPYFLVAGTPQSGKTTLLSAWLLALAERYSPERLILYLVDFRRSLLPLSELPHVSHPLKNVAEDPLATGAPRYIVDGDSFGEAMDEISALMRSRQQHLDAERAQAKASFDLHAWQRSLPLVLLALDDVELVQDEVQQGIKDSLDLHIKKWRDLGFAVIAAGGLSEMESAWGWIAQLRAVPVGFQLGTAAYNQVFKINNLPADNPAKHVPPGDAFYIRRGQFCRVKIADPAVGPVPLAAWVQTLKSRPH